MKIRFEALALALLGACQQEGAPANNTGNAEPAAVSVAATNQDLTLIPPGFERAAAGPSYFFHVAGDVYAAVDPIERKILYLDASGKALGAVALPEGFQVRDIDLGPTISLRGDNGAVELPRASAIPNALRMIELGAPSITVAAAGTGLTLSYTATGGRGSLTIAADEDRKVLAATFIGFDQAGRPYAYWQDGTDSGEGVKAWAGRFDKGGKLLEKAALDLDEFVAIPALPVAVTPPGALLLMRPTEKTIELVKIGLDGARLEQPAGMAPARVLDLGDIEPENGTRADADARANTGARAGLVEPPYNPVFAAAAMQRAQSYLNSTWTFAQPNYERAGIPNHCAKRQGHYWTRPERLTADRIGRTIKGVPYKWGGFDSLERFHQRLTSSPAALAGDICTCREAQYNQCQVPEATGVDCSGFVSRAWGLPSHIGTSQLVSKARDLPDITALKPADILNNPGHHVRMFVRFEPGPQLRIRVVESAVSCGGVCENVYTPGELERYRKMRKI